MDAEKQADKFAASIMDGMEKNTDMPHIHASDFPSLKEKMEEWAGVLTPEELAVQAARCRHEI